MFPVILFIHRLQVPFLQVRNTKKIKPRGYILTTLCFYFLQAEYPNFGLLLRYGALKVELLRLRGERYAVFNFNDKTKPNLNFDDKTRPDLDFNDSYLLACYSVTITVLLFGDPDVVGGRTGRLAP